MFNLDLAVHQWCAEVLSSYSIKNRKIDELKDHLYCLIEKHVDDGLSEQDAFSEAVKNIGTQEELKSMFDQDLTWLNKMCTFEYGSVADNAAQGSNLMKLHKSTQFTQAILWATALLSSAWILKGIEQAQTITMLILVPLATISMLSIRQQFTKIRKKIKD
ncbi:permease prefix domain 1-containing protein [Paraglaciecola sp.]|uniref:permease prefix domain 1-containing protein n=1 Tax=Paraglaciecola sp. TaxID=1920173 RepID=UPI00326499BB